MITHESSLKEFTNQIKYVLENHKAHGHRQPEIKNIVICGLGGSGIAGAIVRTWFFDKIQVPIETVGDYILPAYVNENSLVILSSYSGNTEETLSMLADAENKGAKIIITTSGGKIEAHGAEKGYPMYKLEEGYQPRMTIGYGLSFLLLIVAEAWKGDEGIEEMKSGLQSTITFFEENHERQVQSAETIFNYFISTVRNKFVILADRQFYPIALRFTQQMNENCKLEAFVNPIPESNHNVLESYTDKLPSNFILLHGTENVRTEARFDFVGGHLELENNKVLPMVVPNYDITTIFDVIHRLDWASVMIAHEIGAPLMEVPTIEGLKDFLSSLEVVEESENSEE